MEVDALLAERREAPRVEVLVFQAAQIRTMMWALEPRSIR